MLTNKDFELPKDSLGMMDLIIDIEDEYDILISDSEAASVKTEKELGELIERKVNEKEKQGAI